MAERTRLPRMLQIAVNAGGLEAAIGLTRQFGGQLIYIPRDAARMRDDHPLVRAAGRPAADAIAGEFGGNHNVVPTGTRIRRHLALELLRRGDCSLNEVVRQTDLSYRDVCRMKALLAAGRAPEPLRQKKGRAGDPRQIDLEDYLQGK